MSRQSAICFRPSDEMADAINAYVQANGISISELIRSAILVYVGGDPTYQAIKDQAYAMVRRIVQITEAQIPESYEEAVARGLLDG